MSRLDDPALVQAHYAAADPLAIRIETHRRYSEPAVDMTAWVLDRIAWTGAERVVDVGCGTGSYAAPVAARAARYVAADRSFGMLRGVGRDVARVNLDAQRLPLAADSADVVLANHMLYHVPDRPAALREMRRVLRPDGVLLAATNSADTLGALHRLMARAAAANGASHATALARSPIAFTLENGRDLLTQFFATVDRFDLPTALLFGSAEPALAYVDTLRQYTAPRIAPAAWPDFMNTLRRLIDDEIARHGAWRVPKLMGVFVCTA